MFYDQIPFPARSVVEEKDKSAFFCCMLWMYLVCLIVWLSINNIHKKYTKKSVYYARGADHSGRAV
jgi:hypothetical protein